MTSNASQCRHLTLEIVLEIHSAAIRRFGGSSGLRDEALLDSAVAAPRATFGGSSLYVDTVAVSAAYLVSLCSNHPFVDGNKRTALGACLVHLQLNGYTPAPDGPMWEQLTLEVAQGLLTREEVTQRLRALLL